MELAIPSTLMTCFEWWIYEFGGFFAGMLGNVELAVQHALISVATEYTFHPKWQVTLGIQAATCARVGNALGCGDTAGAILTCKVALFLSGQAVCCGSILLGATKSVVGLLFTSDPNIINLLSHLMSIYCFQQLFDGIVGVSAGIFMGTGKQKIGAVANFIGHYCIGLSVGIVLMFVYKLNILGFWVGLLISVVLQSAFYIVVIFKLNWKSITDEALKRAQVKTKSIEGFMHGSSQCPNVGSESLPDDKEEAGHLSVSQLILRRGITMVTALGLLAVGTCVHILVPPPEGTPLLHANLTSINATHSPLQTVSTLDW
uniref:Uncharacterized protein n=1 Tax=Hippocampus comes TaxID=109280 RepID=A0A3Q2Y585_HIPCM